MDSNNITDAYGVFSDGVQDLERWDFIEAERNNAEWLESRPNHSAQPLNQWSVWNIQLPKLKAQYLSGGDRRSLALFRALSLCGIFRLPMPPWCSAAVNHAYDLVSTQEERGWSDVFGQPNKGKQTAINRQRRDSIVPFIHEASERIESGAPVEKTLRDLSHIYGFSYEYGRARYYEQVNARPVSMEVTNRGVFQRETGKTELKLMPRINQVIEDYIELFEHEPPTPFGVSDEELERVLREHIDKGTPVADDFDWYSDLPPGATP